MKRTLVVVFLIGMLIGTVKALAQETVMPKVEVDVLDLKEKGMVRHVKDNWGKYLIGLAGITAGEMITENNDWLWHKSGGDEGKTITPPEMDASTINDNDFLDVTVIGEGNVVEVNVDYYEDRQP